MVQLYQLAFALATLASSTFAQECATIDPAHDPVWGAGYSGHVVLNGLKTPRGLVFDSLNNLLVVEAGGAGVRYVKLTDNGATDVCVEGSKQLINETTLNHGIDLSVDGKTLFVSSMSTVWGYPYDAAAGTVGTRKTLVTDMSTVGHLTRTLLTSKKNPDVLIVAVGANGNIDSGASDKESGRSQLRIFSIAEVSQASVPYTSGEILAWGLRNSVGVTENPISGGLWSVENCVDDMTRNGVDIHNTNPCEELNFHGSLNGTSPQRGANYGFPDCFAAWDPSVIPNNENITVGTQFAIGTGNDSICADRVAPRLCFPSHNAPLSVRFNTNSTAAYITFHGSWNRDPPDGFRLIKVDFNAANGMPTEPSTSTTAAFDVMTNPDNRACPSGCFRPVDLAFDKGGRLFMTSDATNEVWIIGGT